MFDHGKVGREGNNIERVPKFYGLVVGPVGGIGQGCVGFGAHGGDDLPPFAFATIEHLVELGTNGESIRIAAEAGELGDPGLVVAEKHVLLRLGFEADVAAPIPTCSPRPDVGSDTNFKAESVRLGLHVGPRLLHSARKDNRHSLKWFCTHRSSRSACVS